MTKEKKEKNISKDKEKDQLQEKDVRKEPDKDIVEEPEEDLLKGYEKSAQFLEMLKQHPGSHEIEFVWFPVLRRMYDEFKVSERIGNLKDKAKDVPEITKKFIKSPKGKLTLAGAIAGLSGMVTWLIFKGSKK